jgi:hypothetical protein
MEETPLPLEILFLRTYLVSLSIQYRKIRNTILE